MLPLAGSLASPASGVPPAWESITQAATAPITRSQPSTNASRPSASGWDRYNSATTAIRPMYGGLRTNMYTHPRHSAGP